jgi:hypothetical protein
MRNLNVKATTMLLEGLLESSESMLSVLDNAWSYVWVIVIASKDASSHDLHQLRCLANRLLPAVDRS